MSQLNIKFHRHMTHEDRSKLEENIRKIVHDVFISPADTDYITARFLYLNRQQRAFFWPAMQCLEKYLKANLLLLGLPVKDYSHNLNKLVNQLNQHCDLITKTKLKPHSRHAEVFRDISWRSSDPIKFLEVIHEYGDAGNRYNYYGANVEFSTLLKLDQLVFALRENIAPNMPLEGLSKVESLHQFAYKENMPFAPAEYEHGSVYGIFFAGLSVPTIEIALKGRFGYPELYKDWIANNIKISERELEIISKQ